MEIGDEQVYDYIDASHKIVNTTLFDIIGTKGVTKSTIVVIIVIVHNKNKKNNLNKI